MDKVTQQNAALVEEIAASAMALEERAGDLVESVNVLTLMQDRSSQPASRPRPAQATRSTAHRAAPAAARRAPSPAKTERAKPAAAVLSRASRGGGADESEQDWSSF
jgi:hypothetical protein